MVRLFSTSARAAKDLSKIIDKSGKIPKIVGPATIYNPKSSASNYKGYLKAKIPAGLYYDPAPSSIHGSTNSETIPKSFLPATDPRHNIIDDLTQGNAEISRVAPVLHEKGEKTYHLKPEDIAEIRRLRLEDPVKNSRKALAKKYNCSPLFISIVSEPPKERKTEMNEVLETIKSQWHPKRALARAERKKRKELWYRA
ncbi:Mrpl20 [Kluyveromyces lactis]|nr:Mrpl20 [Kluyveromyces lactis]